MQFDPATGLRCCSCSGDVDDSHSCIHVGTGAVMTMV